MPKHSNKIHGQFKIILVSYPVTSYLDCRIFMNKIVKQTYNVNIQSKIP